MTWNCLQKHGEEAEFIIALFTSGYKPVMICMAKQGNAAGVLC